MNVYLTGIIDWKEQQLIIEGRVISIDEIGGFSLDVAKLIEKENPIRYFESYLSTLLSNDELIRLYTLLGTAKALTITAIASTIGKEKYHVKEIIKQAMQCEVMSIGWNSTYRVPNEVIRDRMIISAKRLAEDKENEKHSQKSMQEIVHDAKQSTNYIESTQEETIHNPDTDESVQSIFVRTAPLQASDTQAYVSAVSKTEPILSQKPSKKPTLQKTHKRH